jgi:hypothetical protein
MAYATLRWNEPNSTKRYWLLYIPAVATLASCSLLAKSRLVASRIPFDHRNPLWLQVLGWVLLILVVLAFEELGNVIFNAFYVSKAPVRTGSPVQSSGDAIRRKPPNLVKAIEVAASAVAAFTLAYLAR